MKTSCARVLLGGMVLAIALGVVPGKAWAQSSVSSTRLQPRSATLIVSPEAALRLQRADEEVQSAAVPICGTGDPQHALDAIRAAVASGRIVDPALSPIPVVRPRDPRFQASTVVAAPIVTQEDIYFFEDTEGILLTNYPDDTLDIMMAAATNTILMEFGDNFDFIGFFTNFGSFKQFGSAFYAFVANDTTGIGLSTFNSRPFLGVAGDNVDGWVMMWHDQGWSEGDGFTQLVLGQEFEHRFALFLDPMPNGRPFQGDGAFCGRQFHWNFDVDGQGSGMEIAEWVGASPANKIGGSIGFNTDIGGVFSYVDLYLMGLVTANEMDMLSSELRFMDNNPNCGTPHNGSISTWGSADIIATNGTRLPAFADAQKNYRTAWVMIHRPEAPPTTSEVQHVVNTLNDWSDIYSFSTLGRGSMDNTLGVPFRIEFPGGTPEFLTADIPTNISVRAVNMNGAPNSTSGLLHYSTNGGPLLTSPLVFLGGDLYDATLPGFACGTEVKFFVTIDSTTGIGRRGPAAPGTMPVAIATSIPTIVFSDDFETNKGWTVSNGADLTAGAWARGFPVGGGNRGDPATDSDGSGRCFLTGPADGNTDVDGGSTTLTSPVIDLSGATGAFLQYARWFTNALASPLGTDSWVAEITGNGVDWVELENTTIASGWLQKTFRITDFVPLTNQVQVRFTASDFNPQSLVEAGLDAVKIISVECAAGLFTAVSQPVDPMASEPLQSDRDFSDDDPNLVVGDAFVADGRIITGVRWWGSSLDMALTEPDGWWVSFHESTEVGVAGQIALGIYFCPAAAVLAVDTALTTCAGATPHEYSVDLIDCCVVQQTVDPRTGTMPARLGAFQPDTCLSYAVGIQGTIGEVLLPNEPGGICVNQASTGRSASSSFWGWSTSNLDVGAIVGLPGAGVTTVTIPGDFAKVYGPWTPAPATCSTPNMAFELLSPELPVLPDTDLNGIADVCECVPSSTPEPELFFEGAVDPEVMTKNSYLSFKVVDEAVQQAIRITVVDLPAEFLEANPPGNIPNEYLQLIGQSMWVGPQQPLCTIPSIGFGDPGCPVPGIFVSELGCDPYYFYWGAIGTIHVHGPMIHPSLVYEIEVVEITCDIGAATSFSDPLRIDNPRRGDVVGTFSSEQNAWSPPDGSTSIGIDVPALLNAFKGTATALGKTRGDIVGIDLANRTTLDGIISLTDVSEGIDGFKGKLYWPLVFTPCEP